jgi:hypothetical protein
MVYNFHCRVLSLPLLWLSLFLGILFFEAIVYGIVFLYSFSVCSLIYRKVTGFCKLILGPATLLKLFIMCMNDLAEVFLGLFGVRSCNLQIGIV